MNILQIISKKRDKKELSKEEIDYFISGYTKGEIPDYQASAFIMAVYINGMTEEEIKHLTLAMAYSGDVLDLSSLGNVIDKHSTGGVGDKITLILMPIMAALGVKVAKMSGAGLGFTGGTKDKLESIPGYQTNLSMDQFMNNVREIGISLIGQTLDLAPADKKIYALRDAISCTNSMPLIASSIMSKKIAAGANKLVIDVMCGSGAFMKNIEDARILSKTMKTLGTMVGKEVVCVITDMDKPLGKSVGNILEVKEAIEALKGNMSHDVEELVLTLGAYMMKLDEKGQEIEENKRQILECIHSGKAFRKFKQLVEKQNGDICYIEDSSNFKKANYILPVISEKEGYITKMQTEEIGYLSVELKAGRMKKEDVIDPTVGLVFEKKKGDFVKKGDVLAYIHTNHEEEGKRGSDKLINCYEIQDEKPQILPDILEII